LDSDIPAGDGKLVNLFYGVVEDQRTQGKDPELRLFEDKRPRGIEDKRTKKYQKDREVKD
jgi:hypothetical protein